MQKLTKDQAIIITGFTGIMIVKEFSHFHEDVEKRLGRSVRLHELANDELAEEIKETYREDFLAMIPDNE